MVDESGHLQSLELTPLGGGNEVGRSCLLLKYKGKTIMLDCGVLPAFTGQKALPYLDEVEPSAVDIIVITHFHLDHCAALPHFTERMEGFKGRIFATHPTIAVMKMILSDYNRVSSLDSSASDPDPLFDEADIDRCLGRMEAVDFHQRINVDGVTLSFYTAGHVLGAAMVQVEISGVRVLYTGDYSCEEDRHLNAAEVPKGPPPDVLVVEATHGMQKMDSREVREKRFTEAVERVVLRGGKCLIPVFALGRAQELLLILDELWASRPDLQSVPIYHANKLAHKGLDVYRTFTGTMNARLQHLSVSSNPWLFKHISHIDGADDFWGREKDRERNNIFTGLLKQQPPQHQQQPQIIAALRQQVASMQGISGDNAGPCVVLASPGMLQHGFSRMLFDRWCEDARNGIVLSGYSSEGTLARQLEANPSEVESMSHRRLVRRMTVDRISFSAHADSAQTSAFIEALKPPAIVLVHGERTEMRRLWQSLARKYNGVLQGFSVHMPPNGTTITLPYAEERMVRILGKLARETVLLADDGGDGSGSGNVGRTAVRIQGLLVKRNFSHLLLHPSDLHRHTELTRQVIAQKMHVPFRSSWGLLKAFITAMFPDCISTEIAATSSSPGAAASSPLPKRMMTVAGGLVTLTHAPPYYDRILVEWGSAASSTSANGGGEIGLDPASVDMIADACIAVITQAEVSQASIKAIGRRDAPCCGSGVGGHSHDHPHPHAHEHKHDHDHGHGQGDAPRDEATAAEGPTAGAPVEGPPRKRVRLTTSVAIVDEEGEAKKEEAGDANTEEENSSAAIAASPSPMPFWQRWLFSRQSCDLSGLEPAEASAIEELTVEWALNDLRPWLISTDSVTPEVGAAASSSSSSSSSLSSSSSSSSPSEPSSPPSSVEQAADLIASCPFLSAKEKVKCARVLAHLLSIYGWCKPDPEEARNPQMKDKSRHGTVVGILDFQLREPPSDPEGSSPSPSLSLPLCTLKIRLDRGLGPLVVPFDSPLAYPEPLDAILEVKRGSGCVVRAAAVAAVAAAGGEHDAKEGHKGKGKKDEDAETAQATAAFHKAICEAVAAVELTSQ